MDLNLRNYDGRTPVGAARMAGHVEAIALIDRFFALEEQEEAEAEDALAQGWVSLPVAQAEELVQAEPELARTAQAVLRDCAADAVLYGHSERRALSRHPPPGMALPRGWRAVAVPGEEPGAWVVRYEHAATGARSRKRPFDPLQAQPSRRYVRRAQPLPPPHSGRGARTPASRRSASTERRLHGEYSALDDLAREDYRATWAREEEEIQGLRRRHRAAIAIQACARCQLARNELLRRRTRAAAAITCVPALITHAPVSRSVSHRQAAASSIQRCWRGLLARRVADRIRALWRAAERIQRCTRAWLDCRRGRRFRCVVQPHYTGQSPPATPRFGCALTTHSRPRRHAVLREQLRDACASVVQAVWHRRRALLEERKARVRHDGPATRAGWERVLRKAAPAVSEPVAGRAGSLPALRAAAAGKFSVWLALPHPSEPQLHFYVRTDTWACVWHKPEGWVQAERAMVRVATSPLPSSLRTRVLTSPDSPLASGATAASSKHAGSTPATSRPQRRCSACGGADRRAHSSSRCDGALPSCGLPRIAT